MGILREPAAFVEELRLPKGFTVCELGDQYVTHVSPHELAEQWYRRLGAKKYVSIDGNGRGTMTHDLNKKLPQKLGPFDLVTDFGTGEHIFDQAQVWRTLHVLTKVGGYIAFDRPTSGYPGHCFYLAAEGLFTDIAEANSYGVIHLERATTPRGELVRGVFKRTSKAKFQNPQQGRYHKCLKVGGVL